MFRTLLLLAALILAAPAHPSAAEPFFRRVTVTPQGEGYRCEAVMVAPVPIAVAWETMSDFDNMSRFVPNLRESRVQRREGSTAWVEQVGVAAFGPLSVEFTSERRLELTPPRLIQSEQVKGTVKRYRSTLILTQEREGTRLTYRVDLEPGPLLGLLLSREFIRHEIAEQFGAMGVEMIRRDAARGDGN